MQCRSNLSLLLINHFIYFNELINEQIDMIKDQEYSSALKHGEFKHEVRQFQKPYDNQQAEQISLMV